MLCITNRPENSGHPFLLCFDQPVILSCPFWKRPCLLPPYTTRASRFSCCSSMVMRLPLHSRCSAAPRSSSLGGHRCAACGLVLPPVQRPVLLGAIPRGPTRSARFILHHRRLALVARREGAGFQAVFRDVSCAVSCILFDNCILLFVQSSRLETSFRSHGHHRRSTPLGTKR